MKRKFKPWVITLWVIVIALVVGAGVMAIIGIPLGWYKSKDDEVADVFSDDEDGDIVNKDDDLYIVLKANVISPDDYERYGVSSLASKAYTVSATLTGDVYDSRVDWYLTWTDGGSHGDVTSYVSLSYDSPYDRYCVIESLSPFSYQISLVAYRTGYPDQSATCVLDYFPTFETGSFCLLNDNDNFSVYCSNYSLTAGTITPDMSCSLGNSIRLNCYDQEYSTACSNLASQLSSCFSILGLSSYATTLVQDFFSLFVIEDGGTAVSFNNSVNINNYTLSSLYEACCNNLVNSSDWKNISATSNITFNDVYSAFSNAFSIVSWYVFVTVTLTYQDIIQKYTGWFTTQFDRFSFVYSDNANLALSDSGLVLVG